MPNVSMIDGHIDEPKKTKLTLAELIELRGNRDGDFFRNGWNTATDLGQGHYYGWKRAYQDLKEILEHNGFDMSVIVIGEKRHYDRIRNMSVEEMAEFILENKIVAAENAVAQMGLAFECSQSSIERCRKEIKCLLESEVTE